VNAHPIIAAQAVHLHLGDPGLPMADRVLAARAGILAVALCAYVLAALFAERRQHESALSESEARLQEALTAGAVTTFVWDVVTGSSQRAAVTARGRPDALERESRPG
jgi:hypothetical protein